MKPRKIPMRMCAGCRERKAKKELIRIVRTPEGEVLLDATGKRSGRGVYICPQAECLHKVEKSRALSRALECEISPEVFAALEKALGETEVIGESEESL